MQRNFFRFLVGGPPSSEQNLWKFSKYFEFFKGKKRIFSKVAQNDARSLKKYIVRVHQSEQSISMDPDQWECCDHLAHVRRTEGETGARPVSAGWLCCTSSSPTGLSSTSINQFTVVLRIYGGRYWSFLWIKSNLGRTPEYDDEDWYIDEENLYYPKNYHWKQDLVKILHGKLPWAGCSLPLMTSTMTQSGVV